MRTVMVLGVGVALLLAGCGGGQDPSSAPGTTAGAGPSSSTATVTPGPSPSGDAFGPSGGASSTPAAPATDGALTSGTAVATTSPAAGPTTPAGGKGLSTSDWSNAANAACAGYAKVLGPGGGGTAPAQVQSRIRDRAWSVTGRLRGLPRGSSQTDAFVQQLYGVGQQSDWLIQQFLDPKADRQALATAVAKRDAQLDSWYAQARKLGTGSCADVMRSA